MPNILVVLIVVFFNALHIRDIYATEQIETVDSSSFNHSQQQVKSNLGENSARLTAQEGIEPVLQPFATKEDRLIHGKKQSGLPRIALHPLRYSQYRQDHANGSEMAELVTSQLMIKLANSEYFELLDRSFIPTLLTEQSRLLVNDYYRSNQDTLKKLPLSEFTLVGSLFSSDKGKSYRLKLIKNNTGQVIGAQQFYYSLDTIEQSVGESLKFINQLITATKNIRARDDNQPENKIAIGHFIDINNNDAQINQGRDITERLIEKFVNDNDYLVLSRTQTFPLVFEEYLRLLQYSDENQDSLRQNTHYLVYGYYRTNRSNSNNVLSIYLYIDQIQYGRELIVLHAENWNTAFELISDAIAGFLPDPSVAVSKENNDKSQELFLQALRTRGMLYDEKILTGIKPPTVNEFKSFASSYKPENLVSTRQLIEQSLKYNPHNQLSKLALAMFIKAEGDRKSSRQIIKEVRRSSDRVSVDIAFKLSNEAKMNASNITAHSFDDIISSDQSEKIYNLLIQQQYLRKVGSKYEFYRSKKLDQVFNHTYALSLAGVDADTAIQVFEKLRSIYYYPGTQVRYIKPRRFHPRDVHNKRKWSQVAFQDKHNTEAILHFDIASSVSSIHINDATRLPSVEFYDKTSQESGIRRQSNLEVAVDGFSSSVYLDTSYLKAMVLLGHSLCQEEINRCGSGNTIHSWVVDLTKAANLKGREGIFFNVTKDIEEKDRLIFLSADAIDRVSDANLTKLFQATLVQEKYLVKKFQAKLNDLLPDEKTVLQAVDREKIAYAYSQLIQAYCIQLTKQKRGLRRPNQYTKPMVEFAEFALQNEQTGSMRKLFLADLEINYPEVYPYLIANIKSELPLLVSEQDEIIAKVASGKIVPYELSRFMKTAARLFETRVNSGNIATAKNYIQYFIDYYGISDKTAMDFAYLYHRVGNSTQSKSLLDEYGKRSFSISNFSFQHANGDYEHNGFDQRGQLKFINTNNPNISIVYQAFKVKYGLGEKPIKWRLSNKKGKSYSGNKNSKHPALFAFGNGGRLTGEMIWTSPMQATNHTNPNINITSINTQTDTSGAYIELNALTENSLDLSVNTIERLFEDGYYIDEKQQTAIKGLPRANTAGPLQDVHFPSLFSTKRKIRVVIDELFKKGYLSVSGVPVFEKQHTLNQQIAQDFPNYSEFEKHSLKKALVAAKKINNSGKAKIYQRNRDAWEHVSTLSPEDAITDRNFGLAAAIHDKHALICDYKDGLYSFYKDENTWVQHQRIESRCNSIAMNKDWAIVQSREKIVVYRNDQGHWQKTQTLIPDNYLVNKDKGHNFEYFGSALAIVKDTIIIGNPLGGANRRGQVYLYTLSYGQWVQTEILQPNKTISEFGKSISANDSYLIIGDPSSGGDVDTATWRSGTVFVYAKAGSSWKFKTHLLPKDKQRQQEFGKKILIKNTQKPSVLVKSSKNIYRYQL